VVEVSRASHSERRDDVTLRRTVVEEIIWKEPSQVATGSSDAHASHAA
jgi:hypothetical protein